MTTDWIDIVHKVDTLWLLVCAFLVMLMQGGFCLLESGFVRAKNSINVAIKNLVDFCVSSLVFWVVGYGLMFGASQGGWIGGTDFVLSARSDPRLLTMVLFQLMFCGTATTIVSGAVAERMRFSVYLVCSVFVSALIYPVFGHWAWGGDATTPGWLKGLGFIDFAGSTAVHSIGGWFALAAVVCMGPRLGRFDKGQTRWQGHNIPMATLGAFLLWFGWFGFNGGCALAFTDAVPRILINTNLAAAAGGLSALFLSWAREKRPSASGLINGTIAGLVSVTAGCHVYDFWAAILVGAVAGLVMVYATAWLEWMHIDDAVGAVPVHAFCGAWGTIAVALLGDISLFGTGFSREKQLLIQLSGVVVAAVWSFGLGMIFCKV
ncbi:MAG: ammonium transporter, partial [Candidatus Saccharimonas sp.]|nr:ammonium transporter [Planctomycetaceae bacterium]